MLCFDACFVSTIIADVVDLLYCCNVLQIIIIIMLQLCKIHKRVNVDLVGFIKACCGLIKLGLGVYEKGWERVGKVG